MPSISNNTALCLTGHDWGFLSVSTLPSVVSSGRYTTESDVWSFGVLLWETFSRGVTPYTIPQNMSNQQTRDEVERGNSHTLHITHTHIKLRLIACLQSKGWLYVLFLILGYRMPAPNNCPDEIYALMCQCWQYDPRNRPSFRKLKADLYALSR